MVGHRSEQVRDRVGHVPDWANEASPPSIGPVEAATKAATFLPCHSWGITGSGGAVVRFTTAVIWSGASAAHSRKACSKPRRLTGVEDRPCIDHRPEGMQVELELRDDAEVAAAAAQPPEQLRVLGLAGVDEAPIRGDEVSRNQVVARQAELPHRPADAAAEREPATPVLETSPPVVASPWAWVSWSTSAHAAPPPTSHGGLTDRRARRSSATGRSRPRRRRSRSRRCCDRHRGRRSADRCCARSRPPRSRPPHRYS